MSRPVILLFCRTYLPGHRAGGPVRTLSNLVDALGDEFDFRIVTLDRDFRSSERYPGVDCGRFVSVGKAQVLYLDPQDITYRRLDSVIEAVAPDILYLNSIMDRVFPLRVLRSRQRGAGRGIPTILAVRGQFNPGAMAIRGRLKRAYVAWLRFRGMLDGLVWQATGEPEREAIRSAIGDDFLRKNGSQPVLAPNISLGATFDPARWSPRIPGEPLRIALLGRITPMKNIAFAIDILSLMRQPARLEIYGPVEDEAYWNLCRERIAKLPAHVGVSAEGAVSPDEVHALLAPQDCFLLPTCGENFGHAIAEALSAGLPAIISDRTPWLNLGEAGVGVVFPLTEPGSFAAELDRLATLSADEMLRLHEACAAHAKRALADPAILAANRALFRHLLSSDSTDPRPA